MVLKEKSDQRVALISGVSFWVAIGAENDIFQIGQLGEWWSFMLTNGLTVGGMTAISLSLLNELFSSSRRMKTTLSLASIEEISELSGKTRLFRPLGRKGEGKSPRRHRGNDIVTA